MPRETSDVEVINFSTVKERIDELCRQEFLPDTIKERIMNAFNKEGIPKYNIRGNNTDDICHVYVNDVLIVELKGKDRDTEEVGVAFLKRLNRIIFGCDIVEARTITSRMEHSFSRSSYLSRSSLSRSNFHSM